MVEFFRTVNQYKTDLFWLAVWAYCIAAAALWDVTGWGRVWQALWILMILVGIGLRVSLIRGQRELERLRTEGRRLDRELAKLNAQLTASSLLDSPDPEVRRMTRASLMKYEIDEIEE